MAPLRVARVGSYEADYTVDAVKPEGGGQDGFVCGDGREGVGWSEVSAVLSLSLTAFHSDAG